MHLPNTHHGIRRNEATGMSHRALIRRFTAHLQTLFYRWALRGRAPERTPIVLTQRRVYVLPTGPGLAYTATLLAMLVGAINYNLSLAHALVFLLAGLGASAILHTFRNLAHLEILSGRCAPVFAGEQATFRLLIANPRTTPRTAVHLFLAGQADTSMVETEIAAESSTTVALELPALRRGWLSLPRITLSTTYPLGLIRAWAYAAPDLRCLVYPSPAVSAPPLPLSAGEHAGCALAVAGMEDFSGLRTHQPTDSPRQIAWKATARQDDGALLTKQFSGSATETLWLDWQALPVQCDNETRLSILCRWVCDAHRAGLRWGLRLPNKSIEPDHGMAHYHACLRQLALYAAA